MYIPINRLCTTFGNARIQSLRKERILTVTTFDYCEYRCVQFSYALITVMQVRILKGV